ncbi:hypothetical protein HER32_16180 [Hymenobacter sp. BT18]|uniref:hypothetical protein n=1 Tax=Hymenobacter sp. BT18 TaxID=2835648 RepID=UPI00143E8A51|nr:hypothetical protein [Hymenobacter sp. BT18]QIX62628.1 hypothetical protein HER32_16180 [Hymenobacter sp. BT18]
MLTLRYVMVLCAFPALFLGSCRSADRIMFKPNPSALSTRLPALEVAVENGPLNRIEDEATTDPIQLFQREAKQNLLESNDSSAKFGYVKLQVTEAKLTRAGKGFHVIQMLGMLTPSLLGIPVEYFRTRLRAELQVLDANGEVVGSYVGTGNSNVRVAMYHGYSQTSAPRLADTEALRQALAQIKPQLDSASARLRTRLISTGPMEVSGTAAGYELPPAAASTTQPNEE